MNREGYDIFNVRFSELLDNMEGKSNRGKFLKIKEKTGISERTLQKYYVSTEIDYFEGQTSVHSTNDYETLHKLSDFFGVQIEYLKGDTDIPRIEIDRLAKELDLPKGFDSIALSIADICKSDNAPIYLSGLYWLLHNFSTDDKEQKYSLLYEIGSYFRRIKGKQETVVGVDVIELLESYKNRTSITSGNITSIADKIRQTILTTDRTSEKDIVQLDNICKELKAVRSELDIIQDMLLGFLNTGRKIFVENGDEVQLVGEYTKAPATPTK